MQNKTNVNIPNYHPSLPVEVIEHNISINLLPDMASKKSVVIDDAILDRISRVIYDNRLTPQSIRYYMRNLLAYGVGEIRTCRYDQIELVDRDIRGIRQCEIELEALGYISVRIVTPNGIGSCALSGKKFVTLL